MKQLSKKLSVLVATILMCGVTSVGFAQQAAETVEPVADENTAISEVNEQAIENELTVAHNATEEKTEKANDKKSTY